jgi:hypothetical protein
VSAYRTAIDQTTRTIERRARYFRNQVVIVVTMGTLVMIAALIMRSPSALWAFLLLVPTGGLFLFIDSTTLNDWRADLLAAWVTRDIDFAAYRDAIRAHPSLPKGTIEAMLASLPSAGSLVAEQQVLTPTRQAVAATSLAWHGRAADALLLRAGASGLLVAVLLAALWKRGWLPLIGLAALALLPVIRTLTSRWRHARCAITVAACRNEPGFSEADYVLIASGAGHPAGSSRPVRD